MKNNLETFKKYYADATKDEVIEDMFMDNCHLQDKIDKALKFIEEHNKNAGNLYYKYDGKYLLSKIKEDLSKILGGKECQ